jgi:hypothetical protein
MSSVLLLDERIQSDGAHARTWAACDGERVQLRDDLGAIGELPVAVLDQVMRRYGRPLAPEIVVEGDSLRCGTHDLRRLRYHAEVDAEARDYLIWQPRGSEAGDEPLACVATTVTAALRFLLERAHRKSETETP